MLYIETTLFGYDATVGYNASSEVQFVELHKGHMDVDIDFNSLARFEQEDIMSKISKEQSDDMDATPRMNAMLNKADNEWKGR